MPSRRGPRISVFGVSPTKRPAQVGIQSYRRRTDRFQDRVSRNPAHEKARGHLVVSAAARWPVDHSLETGWSRCRVFVRSSATCSRCKTCQRASGLSAPRLRCCQQWFSNDLYLQEDIVLRQSSSSSGSLAVSDARTVFASRTERVQEHPAKRHADQKLLPAFQRDRNKRLRSAKQIQGLVCSSRLSRGPVPMRHFV